MAELRRLLSTSTMRWVLVACAAGALILASVLMLTYAQAISVMTGQMLSGLSSQARIYAGVANQTSPERLAALLASEQRATQSLRYRLVTETGRTFDGGLPDGIAYAAPAAETVRQAPSLSRRSGADSRAWLSRPEPWADVQKFSSDPSAGSAARSWAVVGYPLADGGRLIIAREMRDLATLSHRLRLILLATLMAFIATMVVVGAWFANRMMARVREIEQSAAEVMAGDLAARLPLSGDDGDIDRLTRTVNAMLTRIEGLMTSLREVSDNIAHDLRTPLNRLRARAEHALLEGSDPAKLQDALAGTIEDADALMRTFNAMLLVARLEAGTTQLGDQTFDLGRVATDVVELYQPIAEEEGMLLSVQADPVARVRGQRQLIGQVVTNLVENAMKYGGPVTPTEPFRIDVTVTADNESVYLTVADRGLGIAPQDRERALKRFVRLDESRSARGSGLGLSLVAAVARAHGGGVHLQDNAPGLRVVLELPAELAPMPESKVVDDRRSIATVGEAQDGVKTAIS